VSRRPLAPGALRQALRRHGVRPTRALGQNFVTDPNTIRKIVRIADVQPDDTVLEIGPGAGALTVELCQVAKEVVAV
jgi:16S rRNA (adenine1518-N6/adenine1519-N6)-dimethyltransferase